MIGTFPIIEVPTGSKSAGLGNGTAQIFVPVWIQKSFGRWQTYGGVGAWIDLGVTHQHWWYFGWLLQFHVVKWLSIGAELFHETPKGFATPAETRFNIGTVIDFSDMHHLLLSAGRGFEGPNLFQGYVAYQLKFGPKE